MEPQLKELATLGADLQKGLKDLQAAQEKAKTDTSEMVKAQIDKLAEDVADKLKAIQEKNADIEAAMQRVGTGPTAEKAEEVANRALREAYNEYLRKGGTTQGMDPEKVKSLATDNLASGGYLITAQMLGVVQTRIFETSPMRQVANVIKTTSKSVEIILDDDEAGAVWLGEGDSISETSTPTFGRLEIVAKKMAAYPKVTNEMLGDSSIDIESWLTRKLSDKFGRTENTAFISGNGVSQPRGILTYPAWTVNGTYERGKVEQIANGSTTAPTEQGLIQLMGSLKEAYQARASLMMKRATFIEYLKLSGTNVFRFFNLQPQTGSQGQVLGPTLSLLEKPVYLADDMPVIAANSLSVAYGDFGSAYTIVDRTAISVLRDPYTLPGFAKFYAEKRTGGEVVNFEAIKLLRMSVS